MAQMKSLRLQNKISSGPQSNILEGVTWEEVRRMNDDQKAGDHVVMVGAASKGIIQKDYQQNAVVYKSAYSRNPFEGVTDKEIQDYKDYVAKKQRGEPGSLPQPLSPHPINRSLAALPLSVSRQLTSCLSICAT